MARDTSAEDSWVKAEEVKAEWKSLWQSHIDDKVRAEGISDRCFPLYLGISVGIASNVTTL